MALEAFVSHSHKDRVIAEAVVTFLKTAVGLEAREVRCTSYLPTGLTTGATVEEDLRRDLKRCNYFIPLITSNSRHSEFVAFEIGAAWVLGKSVRPLTLGKVPIPSLLSGVLYRDLTRIDDLVKWAEDLASEIFVAKDRPTAAETVGAAKVLAAAAVSRARLNRAIASRRR